MNPAADLSLTKSDSPDPVLVGGTLTYTLTAHNSGPQDTTGVSLTDTLPNGVEFVSATPSQGLCDEASGTVTCSLGALASGASATVTIDVTPQSAGSITNQASVTSDLPDPDAADASATATTTVDPVADLSLTKSDSPDPVLAEHELTYTLSVHNAGPSSAAGATLIDALPSGVTFGSATPSQGSCTESSGTVTCPLGTIASGGDASVEIKVTPTTGGSITNSASVGSSASDPNTSDNFASASTTVNQSADLSASMTDSPDPVVTGEVLTYTITLHNAGPTSAPGVTLTDSLPSGTAYVSAFPSQGSCSQVSGTVTCPLGTVANGADATVAINIRPSTAGSITNQASVASGASDPTSGNNTASAGTTVNAAVGYPRPKGATPLRQPLVLAYAQCTSPNRTHGPPLASPSCNPPVRASSYLTIGSPDANGATANSTGTVRMDVLINANPTPSDVQLIASMTDVRCGVGVTACGTANTSSGPDYTGELEVRQLLRITDKLSGNGGGVAATAMDLTIPMTMTCAQTANTIGSTCSAVTTANALLPGSVRTGSRAIWELNQVQVMDGGPDGLASTAGNGVFAVPGVFVP